MKGETLRELREQNKKTCAEVAQVLGVTKRAVYNYEYGLREISVLQVPLLAEIYHCSIEEVVIAAINSRR